MPSFGAQSQDMQDHSINTILLVYYIAPHQNARLASWELTDASQVI